MFFFLIFLIIIIFSLFLPFWAVFSWSLITLYPYLLKNFSNPFLFSHWVNLANAICLLWAAWFPGQSFLAVFALTGRKYGFTFTQAGRHRWVSQQRWIDKVGIPDYTLFSSGDCNNYAHHFREAWALAVAVLWKVTDHMESVQRYLLIVPLQRCQKLRLISSKL